jgi:hypothetical protein
MILANIQLQPDFSQREGAAIAGMAGTNVIIATIKARFSINIDCFVLIWLLFLISHNCS